MGADSFFQKLTTINFTVKNIDPKKRTLHIFGSPIGYGGTRDLLAIPQITEADIRDSLVKGELANAIRVGSITIVSSSIDLIQFDGAQKAFLENAGVSQGVDLSSTGSTSIANWFVDPENNSTNASDLNDGITSSTPLLTFAEIVRRWGTSSPILTQETSINFLSSHTDNSDPIIISPTLHGCALNIVGIPTVVSTGTLSGVVAKNRATPQLLNANLGTDFTVGNIVKNTTAGKSSYAWVHSDLGSNLAELTQPLSPTPVSPADVSSTPNALIDTWANSDTFQLLSFPAINICKLDPLFGLIKYDQSFEQVLPAIRVYQATVFDPNGIFVDDLYIGRYVSFTECAVQRPVNSIVGTQDTLNIHTNSFFQGSVFRPASGNSVFFGGAVEFGITCDQLVNFDGDIIIKIPGFLPTFFTRASFGLVYIDGPMVMTGGGFCNITPFSSDNFGTNQAILWGPGQVQLQGGNQSLFYAGPASSTGVQTATAATISAVDGDAGTATLTGLTGMTANKIGWSLNISNATNAANNGNFIITAYNSATSVDVANPNAVAGDSHNGSIHWHTTAIFQLTGSPALTINGLTTASAYNEGTGVWTAAIALTPTNLDTAQTSGFGGTAIQVSTNCSISNLALQYPASL